MKNITANGIQHMLEQAGLPAEPYQTVWLATHFNLRMRLSNWRQNNCASSKLPIVQEVMCTLETGCQKGWLTWIDPIDDSALMLEKAGVRRKQYQVIEAAFVSNEMQLLDTRYEYPYEC
jgi:hypothetical protein